MRASGAEDDPEGLQKDLLLGNREGLLLHLYTLGAGSKVLTYLLLAAGQTVTSMKYSSR